ncbi:MAG: PqiC family protein [Desulfobacterales bacterium]|jgi:uncharacterized lipoprotein YmbA
MMTRACLSKIGLAVWMVIFILTGCRSASSPIEFYTLTPLSGIGEADEGAGLGDAVAVGVGPLQMPKIIDRPQIVSRTGVNGINVDEFHRWGGSLYEDFLTVLTLNLSALLRSNMVAAYPWEEYFDPDYRIYLEVYQFDGRLGEYALLNITWTVTGRRPGDVLRVRNSVIKEAVQSGDYEAFVAAKSRILAALSREMAREIMEIQAGK